MAFQYPSDYDDNAFLGPLVDQKALSLTLPVDETTTALKFDSIAEVPLPTYLRIDTMVGLELHSEVVYVTESNDLYSEFTNVSRGALGSTPIAHNGGDPAYVVITAQHVNEIKDAALAVQKHHGLVGPQSGMASRTPEVGEQYLDATNKLAYACIQAGVWSLLGGFTAHSSTLFGGQPDDHPQYHTKGRLDALHTQGNMAHVTGGDSHDHSVGAGAGRVRAGHSSTMQGSPSTGEIFYTTDNKEFFVAHNGWQKVTGAPIGLIMIITEADAAYFGGNCPPGFVRYTALDGRMPKGADTTVVAPLTTGGSASHSHTYSDVPSHTHQKNKQTATSSKSANHSHNMPLSMLAQNVGAATYASSVGSHSFTSNVGGAHTHLAHWPSYNTSGTVKASDGTQGSTASSASTSEEPSMPPYQEVIFCIKA